MGMAADARLIGIVGRLDPMKDHQNFLRAAALVARRADDLSSIGPPELFCCSLRLRRDGPPDYRRN